MEFEKPVKTLCPAIKLNVTDFTRFATVLQCEQCCTTVLHCELWCTTVLHCELCCTTVLHCEQCCTTQTDWPFSHQNYSRLLHSTFITRYTVTCNNNDGEVIQNSSSDGLQPQTILPDAMLSCFATTCGYNWFLAWKDQQSLQALIWASIPVHCEANPSNGGHLHRSIHKPWEKSIKISLLPWYVIYNRRD